MRDLSSAFVMKFDSSDSLDSPPFVFQDATWCLRLYPNYRSKTGFDFIGLNIVRLSSHVPHHKLQYLLIPSGNKRGVFYQVADFDEDHRESGEMEFIFRYEGSPSVPKNMVKVTCQVSCYGSHALDVIPSTEPLKQNTRDLGDLCQDFKKLLLNGRNHDLVLKVKGEELRAHQDILRVRSPVLESMLDHDMIEKTRGVVEIPDCDPAAFRQFLLYLYSGEVEALDADNMLSVYYIADKYDMGHLKEVCREFAKRSLTYASVSDVIQLALTHSDTLLLEHATEFFVKEMRFVLPTVEWQSFVKRNPTQANELFIKATENLYAEKK